MSETATHLEPVPSEQFEDRFQQRQAATLGVWVFLATEVLFFGSLFTGYFIMRSRFLGDFVEGAHELKWWLGGINTAVLLLSSYFMAMAVHAAHEGDNRHLIRRLLYTAGLGAAFLAIKLLEYFLEYREGLVPVFNFTRDSGHLQLFMVFYFIMTLFHALHLTIGIAVVLGLAWLARRGWFSKQYLNPVEGVGLYWHFVDLVWVFLYPTLYLLRHA